MRVLQSSAAMKWREVVEVQTAPATAGHSLKFKSCKKKKNEGQAETAPLESIQYGLIKRKGRCFTCLHLFQNTVSQGMLHYMFLSQFVPMIMVLPAITAVLCPPERQSPVKAHQPDYTRWARKGT